MSASFFSWNTLCSLTHQEVPRRTKFDFQIVFEEITEPLGLNIFYGDAPDDLQDLVAQVIT